MDDVSEEIENICKEIRENGGKRPEWMQSLAELEATHWQITLNKLAEHEE